ncbi:MAG: thiamine pyrophosphate-binding protein [Chloroflexi bacterium]|nr:thiamine pyrophosphate-binding protein [Chloroflexota bacterium]
MKKLDVVKALALQVTPEDLFVSSIGMLQHDWWNYRPNGVDNTLSPGVLGSVSSIALGLAVALPHRRIVALDTDGSMLLNTGILCTLGNESPPNLTVIVFDNGVYQSIGGPPTLTSFKTDLAKMAEGAGCLNCVTVRDVEGFSVEVQRLLNDGEMGYLVAKIEPGDYPWPREKRRPWDGVEDKYRFIRYVEKLEGITIHAGSPG